MTAHDEEGEGEKPIHRAPAVARAASILRMLSGAQTGLGVSEIARRVGLVPSTCLHILRALVEEGFVAFDEEKKTYRTGVGLLTLVRSAMSNARFSQVVQPTLDVFARDHPVTAAALELDSRERMVVVALARADALVSLHIDLGSRLPAYLSATGRCFAASSNKGREELKASFEALRWERAPKFEDWWRDVERTRREGVAVDYGHFIRGLTVVAASLPPTSDRIPRCLALVGFEHQLTERLMRRVRSELVTAAGQVAASLS